MTKRAKIIIGAVIAVLLALAGAAAIFANSGTNPNKSSNQIKSEIEKAFEGKDYFKEVDVKTYAGTAEEDNPDAAAPSDRAGSAAVQISLTRMDAASFQEVASLLPELKMISYYSISYTDDISNIISASGFKYADLKNADTVQGIADSLKVRETYESQYWQVSSGNAEGSDVAKMKTQFVTTETNIVELRKTVDEVLTPKMDVLPVTKTDLSEGSFSQFAAVEGKMTNYDKGLEIGLKFADAAFLDSQQVVFLGLGDDVQITYTSLREGLSKDKLTEIAKELNKDQLFKIVVVSPEEAQAGQSAPVAPSAEPTEGTSTSPVATPTPSE